MPEPTVRNASLVAVEPGSPFPKLRARRCECGHVSCPPQTFGCERCGRTDSVELALTAAGVLSALAVVRVHTKIPTPYSLGRVALDEGPVLDVRVEEDARLAIGSRVRGRLFEVSDPAGETALECRFALAEQAP